MSAALQFYLYLFGGLALLWYVKQLWYEVVEFFKDGRSGKWWERLLSGDVFLDFLDDLGTWFVDLLFLLPNLALLVAGAFVIGEFLKSRVPFWGAMTGVAAWTSLIAGYMVQEHLRQMTARVCELIVEPKIFNLFHHEGYKLYYDQNRQIIDRLWSGPHDDVYREEFRKCISNEHIRFVINGHQGQAWSEIHKSLHNDLAFSRQMFGDPFSDRVGHDLAEPYLCMEAKTAYSSSTSITTQPYRVTLKIIGP